MRIIPPKLNKDQMLLKDAENTFRDYSIAILALALGAVIFLSMLFVYVVKFVFSK